MPYKRAGKTNFYFQAKSQTGRKQLSTGARTKRLATKIEGMWHELAAERAWDILDHILTGTLSIGELLDFWTECNHNLADVRRLLADADLDPLVEDWYEAYSQQVTQESADVAYFHVRALITEGEATQASHISPEFLHRALYAYTARDGEKKPKRNTLRKVHSSWSVFFEYCTRIRGLYPHNPMGNVNRPRIEDMPIRFYDLLTVKKIVGHQPTEVRRAYMALLYGSGIEVSTALKLRKTDVDPPRKEVRAAGTKTYTRDRVVRVAEWAWPIFWDAYAAHLPASAYLFPGWSRHTPNKWHRHTTDELELDEHLPMHNSRHHWAVRAARAGAPIAVIQQQLGHSTAHLALKTYGRFVADSSDRHRWEMIATERESGDEKIG